jgi:hypothetical protein
MFTAKDYWNEISEEFRKELVIRLKIESKKEMNKIIKRPYHMLNKDAQESIDQEMKYIMNRVILNIIDRNEG